MGIINRKLYSEDNEIMAIAPGDLWISVGPASGNKAAMPSSAQSPASAAAPAAAAPSEALAPGATPFINEFHYDNIGTDTGESIEIVVAEGTDVSGYSIVRYNGNVASAAVTYATPAASNSVNLSALTPTTVDGISYYVVNFLVDGLQNGDRDGFALVNNGVVIQLLSYEGIFTVAMGATGGPAAGMTSTDVGVTESNTAGTGTPIGFSLQLTGSGDEYSDFTWAAAAASTFGAANNGQTFTGAATTISIQATPITHDEGNAGTTAYVYTLTRTSGSADATVDWAVTGAGGLDATDFAGGVLPSGTATFVGSALTTEITINVVGDVTVESNENFTVTLTNPSAGYTLGAQATQTGTITNDDVAPGAGSLSIADNSVTEGNGGTTNLSFTVSRTGGSAGAGQATWTITFEASDTANAADLGPSQSLTGTVSFADGETSKNIDVAIAGDLVIEGNETFTITLSAPTGGITLTDAVATGTITNDDVAPVPGTLSIGDSSVSEGNDGSRNASFTVTRSGGDDGAVSATWTLGFGTADAVDFGNGQALSGTVSFADGETSKTILVAIAGDLVIEPDETYTMTLSAPTGGASLGDASGAGTIVNNDVNVFINEIHYDDAGTDAGEAIEIAAAAGTDLSGWTLVLYNLTGGATYATINLTGIIPNQDDGYGTLSFAAAGLQNGPNDGIALVNPSGVVVQFLSYEGTLTATNGPAAGLTSTDIGVTQDPAPADGLSLQLIGTGSSYADFQWAASPAAFSFGAVNASQDFLGTATIGQIRVSDPSVAEGNSGTQQLVFTISREGGLGGSGTVDYTIALNGTADAADIAPGAIFAGTVSFAPGEYSKQVAIGIQGDLTGEPNETLSITLSNATGSVAIADANGTATIVNDDPIVLAIHDIQGAGHTSPVNGQPVVTSGIVTAIDSNGYYIQDPNPDSNDATSEGIFVFTSTAPTGVAVGDLVTITGTVSEFTAATGSLSVTELIPTSPVVVNSSGNALPAAILIGAGGRLPPTSVIDDDGLTSFNPATDGIDFYESMEGMRVTIAAPKVVANTNGFGETWVVADGGAGATGISARNGITISDGDFNPEKIQIDDDSTIFAGYTPGHSQGDILSNVTGIVNYSQGNFEVLVTQAVTTTTDVTLTAETTTLEGDSTHLAIASFNLENIDPTDTQQKFDVLAGNIVFNLSAPDIIAVQEVQDADGAGGGSDYSGAASAARLIAAIDALGGPHYVYIEIAPTANNQTGGESNGNIRNGYLYNPDRVGFVAGSMELVPGSAFNGSRSPLAADFTFNGTTVTLINVHSTSRIGSDPLFGANQPPLDAGDGARTAQAQAIRDYIDANLATNPNLHFGVLGDFNGFYFEDAIETLTAGGLMTDLHTLNASEERYSYIFDGNLQAIDHILFTGGLMTNAQYDAVHINAEAAPGTFRGTDHDPQLALLHIPLPDQVATLSDDTATTDEASSVIIDVLANDGDDPDGPNQPGGQKPLIIEIDGQDVAAGETVSLTSGATVTFNSDGTLTYDPNGAFNSLVPASSGAANGSAIDSFTYTVAGGATADVNVTVNGLASAGDIYEGDQGNNVITGTPNADFFDVDQGGDDDLSGEGGNDVFLFGPTLTSDDKVDGGGGTDQIAIQGDYSGGLTFGTEVVSIESLAILPGSDTRFGDPGTNFYSYDLTLVDENVAAGVTMIVDANRLRVGENFTFDGSAETDGAFFIYGGGGTDTLTGGANNDTFYFGENGQWGASDTVDGGPSGADQLALRGDYTITFGAGQLVGIEAIGLVSAYDTRFGPLGSRYDYNLTMNDGNVLAGQQMTVDAAPLRSDETFTFNGSAELDGSFRVYGGRGVDSITGSQGADRICGGQGGDTLRGGGGNDVFVYRSILDSLASGDRDGIQDFTTGDKIDLSAIDAIDGGPDNAFTFIGATAFSGTAGELRATESGGIWTVSGDVDGDTVADIQFFVVRGDPNPIVGSDFVL